MRNIEQPRAIGAACVCCLLFLGASCLNPPGTEGQGSEDVQDVGEAAYDEGTEGVHEVQDSWDLQTLDARDAEVSEPPKKTPPGPNPKNAAIFEPNKIVDFYVEVDQAEFDGMVQAGYEGKEVYIPCNFTFQGETFYGAAIRLKGNPSDWHPDNKPQFVIKFNYYDKNGRFRGLRRIFLEASPGDDTLCRNNIALHVMRRAGAVTPRSNHARLFVNGQYFGLYENIEYVDREFLEDRFADPSGNLYKYGEILKTNEHNPDTSDLEEFEDLVWGEPLEGDHTEFFKKIQEIVDIPALLRHTAGEAILPAGDTFFSGGWNYFLYHEPGRGFVIIPWDLDGVFYEGQEPVDADPLTWTSVYAGDMEPHPLWALVRQKPEWRRQHLENIAKLLTDTYQGLGEFVEQCCERVWPALENDPNRPFSQDGFDKDCQYIQDFIKQRSAFLKQYLKQNLEDQPK